MTPCQLPSHRTDREGPLPQIVLLILLVSPLDCGSTRDLSASCAGRKPGRLPQGGLVLAEVFHNLRRMENLPNFNVKPGRLKMALNRLLGKTEAVTIGDLEGAGSFGGLHVGSSSGFQCPDPENPAEVGRTGGQGKAAAPLT